MSKLRTPRALGAIAVAAVLSAFSAQDALACGGCFSPPSPTPDQIVVQDAERVLFVRDEKNKTSHVWVEVRYSGLAKDFGWVLPLPKLPKVGVGTGMAFDALDLRMAARYRTSFALAENCRSSWDGCVDGQWDSEFGRPSSGTQDASSAGDAGTGGGPKTPNVEILAQGTTGPYDYVVVKGSEASVLYDWLNTRGYATPQTAKPILQSHIDKGDVFVAVKLSNGQGVEAIRPITLEMDTEEACVPLRLTSIAAKEDMSVVVTVAGPGRAIVKNYLDVEPNPLRMTLTGGSNQNLLCAPSNSGGTCMLPGNFNQVVAAAVDEAGGRAFVTESSLAGKDLGKLGNLTPELAEQLKTLGDLKALATWLGVSGMPVNDEVAETVAAPFKLKETFPNVAPVQALANLRACGQFWQNMGFGDCPLPSGQTLSQEKLQLVKIDGAAAQQGLKNGIIDPLFLVGGLLADSSKITRLSMRISPSEMDRDPVFSYNAMLADVPAERDVVTNPVCLSGWDNGALATRLTVPGLGSWIFSGLNTLDARFAKAPAALWVRLQDESGLPTAIDPSQIELVDTAIKGALPGKSSLPKDMVLKTATPWSPPKSDVLVTQLGPWKKPAPWCKAKDGWADGQPAPSGQLPKPDAISGDASDTSGSGPVPGVDAVSGWTDANSPQAKQPTTSAAKGADDSCSAQPTGSASGPAALGLLLVALATRLRRRRAS
jgi:MYXO-CTERM domain-containing protein